MCTCVGVYVYTVYVCVGICLSVCNNSIEEQVQGHRVSKGANNSPTVLSLSLSLSALVGLVSGSDERVVVALEELMDLKGVWSELSKVWEKIEELKEKPWLSVAPRKIRQALDALLQQLRGFPTRLKSYASFEYVQATLKGYTKVHILYMYTCIHACICTCKLHSSPLYRKEDNYCYL